MNNVDHLNLGKPIGDATQPHPTTGEHGVGTGVSGGHSSANAHNSQAGGAFVGGSSAFNAGLGGEHASAGLPRDGSHPIADKFMGQSGGQDTVSGSYEGGSTRDALAGQSHGHTTGHGAASGLGAGAVGTGAGLAGAGAGAAIAGQYAGSGTNDALTGQSDARIIGEGVGPLGENTSDHARAAGLSSTAGGAAGAAAGAGVIGNGVGPQGGAGGHYSSDSNQTGSRHEQPSTTSNLVKEGEATGHFGHADNDESRGLPISDPKSLDSGGPHGLVYQESTGKYVHRHELEGNK